MTTITPNSSRLQCPKCHTTLLGVSFVPDRWDACPSCNSSLQIEVFPALFRPPVQTGMAENLMLEGESSCFYHPQKKAVIPCAICGRFLCALCDCDLQGEHLCPTCLELGKRKGRNDRLVESREMYRTRALQGAFIPLFLTGLMAIYYVIRYRNAPPSLVSPKPWAMSVALVVAILQLLGFAGLIGLLI